MHKKVHNANDIMPITVTCTLPTNHNASHSGSSSASIVIYSIPPSTYISHFSTTNPYERLRFTHRTSKMKMQ